MKKKIIYFSVLVAALGSLKAQDHQSKQISSRHTGALAGSGAAQKNAGKSKDAQLRNKNTSSVASVSVTPCFDKGTGTDGAYHATVDTTYIAGGVYNFTSFTIDAGVHVLVTGPSPLVVNCTGLATINGTLSANGGKGEDGITYDTLGHGGKGVAGGENGGNGAYSDSNGPLDGIDGVGTGGTNNHGSGWSGGGGGGYAAPGSSSGGGGGLGGPNYGNANLNPVLAGSGGGGGSGGYSCGSGGGGAGGGIIKINADTVVVGASGLVSSNGGDGGSDGGGNCGGGGGGSGGAIALGATALTINGSVTATGGAGGGSAVSGSPYYGAGGNGAAGRIRLTYSGALLGSGTVSPAAGYTATPSALMVTGTSPICSGTSTLLTGSGATTYTWSTGANTNTVTVSPTSNTTYTVSGTDNDGCVSMDTFMVAVNAQPNILASVTTPTVCSGVADTLIATGGVTYLWSSNAGSVTTASVVVTTTTNATYTVTGTGGNGCSNTATVTVNVMSCSTGISSYANHFAVYPNPSAGRFVINVQQAGFVPQNIKVLNMLGAEVYGRSFNNDPVVDLSSHPGGVYFMVISAGGQSITKKIVKE